MLAVGILSALGTKKDKANFHAGFKEMVNRLEPSALLIYGRLLDEDKPLCHKKKIYFCEYPTEREQYEARKNSDRNILLFDL